MYDNKVATLEPVKLCRYLKEYRPLSEFNLHKDSPDGLQSYCISGKKLYDANRVVHTESTKVSVKDDTVRISVGDYKEFLLFKGKCPVTGDLHTEEFPLVIDYLPNGNIVGTINKDLEFVVKNARINTKFKKALIAYLNK